MSGPRIPLARPVFDDDDRAALLAPLETGWVVQGPHVAAFEAAFAAYTGAPRAAACSSATTGLHLALAALGVGPGDRVVVPALTWVATANAVLYCGATPVFADVDVATFNLAPDALARAARGGVKAVMPVHLFGLPADLDAVAALAPGALVVEDAACGLDARVGGRHVGTFGDAGVFSFHPRKAVTTGEGGMVLAADPAVDARLRAQRSHGGVGVPGRAPFLMGDFPHLGFNYRMTDFQGALGVTQMAKAARLHARRAALAARYNALLADVDWLGLPAEPAGGVHGWQAYVCLYRPQAPDLAHVDALHAGRNRLMAHLGALGIETRPGTHAVHMLDFYRESMGLCAEDCPGAWVADRASFALPLFPTLTEAEQDEVVAAIRAFEPGRAA
ncbi:MAG: DegT/DnrJ/EryC1/StrS family aminotransferase [Myxococcales bacterium]|nr:DegT/DnrJ/EryC1/StrS family aminotransferase [Myxococcales bacterium]